MSYRLTGLGATRQVVTMLTAGDRPDLCSTGGVSGGFAYSIFQNQVIRSTFRAYCRRIQGSAADKVKKKTRDGSSPSQRGP